MSTSPASSSSVAAAALWSALDPGARSLPLPAPAGLCELPLARLSRYEPRADPATGRLDEEEWVHLHRVRALSGQWWAVRVAGDAALGLPRAGDWPVLMAVVRLFDDAGWTSNTLADVSIRRLLATMGVTGGGKMVRRVRDALVRFAHVRVLLAPMAAADEPGAVLADVGLSEAGVVGAEFAEPGPTATGVTSGVALWSPARVGPRRPGRAPHDAPRTAEGGAGRGIATGVLDVAWRGDALDRVTIAEAWRPRGGPTPTSWLDYDRYFALGDPVAQRLYQLYAGAAARGEAFPFEHDLDWLRSALGLSARFKRSRVLAYLRGALAELRGADIVGEALVERAERGGDRVVVMPGPVLEAARLFAGLALEVPRDARVQLAALQAVGVHRAEADRLLRADPVQVYEVLCYVLWATRHGGETIRDPGAYVRRAVADGYRFAKPAYLAWRAGAQRRSLDLVRARAEREGGRADAGVPDAPAPNGAAPNASVPNAAMADVPGGAVPPPNAVPDVPAAAYAGADPDAAALWAAAAAAVRARVGPRELRLLWVTTQLDRVTGVRLDGDALICATGDLALRGWAAGGAGRALLGAVVGELTAGAVTRVVVRLPGDVDREDEAGD